MPFPTCFRWPKSWCDRPNRANQPDHPSTAPQPRREFGLRALLALAGLGLTHKWGSRKHLVRRSSTSLTKLMQAHSLFLVYPSKRSLHTHTPEGRKRQKDPREKQPLSPPLAMRRSAHAGPGPTRAQPPFPIPTLPRARRNNHPHNNTTKQPLSVSTAVGRASTSHPVSTRPALPANTLAHPHEGKARAQKALDQKGKPRPLLSRPQNPRTKLQDWPIYRS